jgi:endo-1,3-1,4-beta-glycanase ExoK
VPVTTQAQMEDATAGAFLDEFESLDRNRWFVSDGWTNGAHQNCLWRGDRVRVENGLLALSLSIGPGGALGCGEIQTKTRFGYGTYEARMKVPYAAGMNASLFTFIGAPQDLPHNEIDFEFIAPDEPVLQTNVHFEGDSDNEMLTPMPADGNFRTFSVTWAPDSIRWYIDGDMIREEEGGPVPNETQKLYLSIWSTDTLVSWLGRFDPATAPQVLEVDWVSFTPQDMDCQFEGSVLCDDGFVAAE